MGRLAVCALTVVLAAAGAAGGGAAVAGGARAEGPSADSAGPAAGNRGVLSECARVRSVPLAGGPVRTITPDGACVRLFAPSPDVRSIAYVHQRLPGADGALVVADADGGNRRVVVAGNVDAGESGPWRPWSSDGRLLAYTHVDWSRCQQTFKWCTVHSIRVVDLLGRQRGLIRGAIRGVTEPRWSPGARLAFSDAMTVEGSDNLGIGIARADGSRRRRLVRARGVGSPDWITRSTLMYRNQQTGLLMRIGSDGRGRRTLGRGHGALPSPDGRRIAYLRGLVDGSSLHLMRSDGREQRRIATPERLDVGGFAWSHDGRRLAVATFERQVEPSHLELRLVSLYGRTVRVARRLPHGVASGAFLQWSKDGERLYVTA